MDQSAAVRERYNGGRPLENFGTIFADNVVKVDRLS